MDNTDTTPIDPRHVARALALQNLFTELIAKQDVVPVEDLLSELEVTNYDEGLMQKIIAGVKEHVERIDPVIKELAPAWPIEQIFPVDLLILRMGIWEGFVSLHTPAKVVINEMIELGKQFGGPNSSSFINGVLGSLISNDKLQEQLKLPGAVPAEDKQAPAEKPAEAKPDPAITEEPKPTALPEIEPTHDEPLTDGNPETN